MKMKLFLDAEGREILRFAQDDRLENVHFERREESPQRSLKPRKDSESGAALIVVLWMTVILAFAVAVASERVEFVCSDTVTKMNRYQAELRADAALATLPQIFKREKELTDQTNQDPSQEQKKALDLSKFPGSWTSTPTELDGGSYWIEIVDEQSKINWIKTSPKVWDHLFKLAEVPEDQASAWRDCLKDWQDADDNHGLNGAETSEYTAQPERRKAKNAPITEFGELYWILGGPDMLELEIPIDAEGAKRKLGEMTTIYGNGQINVNTAPTILIAAGMGGTLEAAATFVMQKAGPDGVLNTADDVLLKAPGASGAGGSPPPSAGAGSPPTGTNAVAAAKPTTPLTASSSLFRLRAIGEFQNQRVVREALIVPDRQNTVKLVQQPRTLEAYCTLFVAEKQDLAQNP